jgi:hypothetical protein
VGRRKKVGGKPVEAGRRREKREKRRDGPDPEGLK